MKKGKKKGWTLRFDVFFVLGPRGKLVWNLMFHWEDDQYPGGVQSNFVHAREGWDQRPSVLQCHAERWWALWTLRGHRGCDVACLFSVSQRISPKRPNKIPRNFPGEIGNPWTPSKNDHVGDLDFGKIQRQGYYTEKPRVMDDLNEHERMQMALMGVLTFEGVKKATQKEAPRREKNWVVTDFFQIGSWGKGYLKCDLAFGKSRYGTFYGLPY